MLLLHPNFDVSLSIGLQVILWFAPARLTRRRSGFVNTGNGWTTNEEAQRLGRSVTSQPQSATGRKSEAVFLVSPGTSSLPARHEV
jgi:hypothetical protein